MLTLYSFQLAYTRCKHQTLLKNLLTCRCRLNFKKKKPKKRNLKKLKGQNNKNTARQGGNRILNEPTEKKKRKTPKGHKTEKDKITPIIEKLRHLWQKRNLVPENWQIPHYSRKINSTKKPKTKSFPLLTFYYQRISIQLCNTLFPLYLSPLQETASTLTLFLIMLINHIWR